MPKPGVGPEPSGDLHLSLSDSAVYERLDGTQAYRRTLLANLKNRYGEDICHGRAAERIVGAGLITRTSLQSAPNAAVTAARIGSWDVAGGRHIRLGVGALGGWRTR
jgi:hypothetical protein